VRECLMLWRAVSVEQDKYTAMAELKQSKGYFIRAAPNERIEQPVQACLYIETDGVLQAPHNIIIAEEGSELNIITGCRVGTRTRRATHLGISEFYVKKNATVIFTMIHSWSDETYIRPRTGAIIEEGRTFISNYILIKPVRDIQSYPTAYLTGRGARAKFNTVMYASKDSVIDLGNRIILMEEGHPGSRSSRLWPQETQRSTTGGRSSVKIRTPRGTSSAGGCGQGYTRRGGLR